MRRWPNAGLLFAHRLRRWSNTKPMLGQCLMFAGSCQCRAKCAVNIAVKTENAVSAYLYSSQILPFAKFLFTRLCPLIQIVEFNFKTPYF